MFNFGDYSTPAPGPPTSTPDNAATVAAIHANNQAMLEHQRRSQRMALASQFHAVVGSRTTPGETQTPTLVNAAEEAAFNAACRLLQREFDEGV